MDKFMSVVAVFGVVAAVLLQCTAAQTLHVVGGNLNWTVPSGNTEAYSTWAANQTFVVGDTLVFKFVTGEHDVVEVEKESYDACTEDKAIGNTTTIGPANKNLDSAGSHYYICTIGQHCKLGQKLFITVSASAGASPPTTTTSTTDSSSSGVFASFFVCFFSVVIGFFF